MKIFTYAFFVFISSEIYAQQVRVIDNQNSLKNMAEKLQQLDTVNADSVIKILSTWNRYPIIEKTNQNYLFYYDDSFFGKVPVRLYIPSKYRNDRKTPLILLLHGALGLSSFNRADDYVSEDSSKSELNDDDIFFNYFSKQGYIIIRPFADPAKKFNWVYNAFNGFQNNHGDNSVNLTFETLSNIIITVKQMLNVEDSRVYAFGHSDGSDGAFCLGLYKPSLFAGFICYNSMLTNLQANNIYLKNVENRAFYIVHSDLDDLRPIQQAREIIKLIKSFDSSSNINYKEYIGYKHYDKHLQIDLPMANQFMLKTSRNPASTNIYWESNNNFNNQCDWIKVNSFDLTLPKAIWHDEIKMNSYNKKDKRWETFPYYSNDEGYAIKGSYLNNTFTIKSSRIKEFEILISDKMVDLNKPIKVYVNGKLIFNKKVAANKNYIIKTFECNFDREAVWLNSIKIKN